MEHLRVLLLRGWTQERIAKAIGVSQPSVSLWLSGKRKPGGAVLKMLEILRSGVDG